MAKLHKNTNVKVTKKAFSSINALHLLRESKFHCNLVLTKNALSTTLAKNKLDFEAQHGHATAIISKEVQLREGGNEGNGINNHNGGGKGYNNGSDDDNYFHKDVNVNDNGTQEGRFTTWHDPDSSNFDPNFVQVIFQEWATTIHSLPS